MSRCFPFPPPGYEKKHRPEDLDSLKEAKLKEKKHRKEKKDKERRKDKEKREKDGSDEKYRDKKDKKRKHRDKKEKHREKKKEKNQGKDKEKSSISEESTVAGKLDDRSGEKLHPKEHGKDRISFVDEGKGSAPFQGQNGEKPCQNSLLSQGTEESKFVQDLDWRNRDDKMGTGSELLERVPCAEKRDQQATAKSTAKNSSGVLADNNKDKRVQNNKMDVQELRNEFSGNTMVQNFTGMAKSKGEGIPRPLEEHKERRLEGKKKFKEMGEKRTDKHKDRDKRSHGKNKEKEREKKKEKTKEKTENNKSEQDWTKDVGKSDLGFPNIKSTDLLKDANSSAVSEGNIRKRKDMDTNGFLHDSEARPNKLLRVDSHQLTENGRKLEACRPPSKSGTDKHGVLNSFRLDNRDLLVNGMIEPQKPSPSRPNTSIAATISNHIAEASKASHPDSKCLKEGFTLTKVEDQIAEAKKRPPHTDSKYLNEVLTIPKVDDLSQINEQEWLFNRKDPSNKPKVESFGVNDEICVWSEAVHIESADVCALPYVVPY